MWVKDHDRQFINKEIQTSIKPAYNQSYEGSATQNHKETGKNQKDW